MNRYLTSIYAKRVRQLEVGDRIALRWGNSPYTAVVVGYADRPGKRLGRKYRVRFQETGFEESFSARAMVRRHAEAIDPPPPQRYRLSAPKEREGC